MVDVQKKSRIKKSVKQERPILPSTFNSYFQESINTKKKDKRIQNKRTEIFR